MNGTEKHIEEYHKENVKRLDNIQSTVDEQKRITEKHFEDDAVFQKDTNAAINQLNELLPIVREKLLPAYDNEQKNIMLAAWAKEKAKSVSFWLSILASFAGFVYGLLYVIKQFLKP